MLSRSGFILCLCLAGCAARPTPTVALKPAPKVSSLSVATPPPPATPPPMRRSSAQTGRQTLYVGPPPKPKARPTTTNSPSRGETVATSSAARPRTTKVIRPAQPQVAYPVRTDSRRFNPQPATFDLLPPPPLPPGYNDPFPPVANQSGDGGWSQRPNEPPRATTAETILRREQLERQERIRRTNEAIIQASQARVRGPQWPAPPMQRGGPQPPYPAIPGGW